MGSLGETLIHERYFIIMSKQSSNFTRVISRKKCFLVIFLPLLVLLFFRVLSGPGQVWSRPPDLVSPEIRAALARIDSLLTSGEVQTAFSLAADLHSRQADHLLHGWQIESRLGVIQLRMGNPREAVAYLENAVRKAPGQPENHRNLGTALLRLGRKGRALSEFGKRGRRIGN